MLYEKIVELCRPYLGLATEAFINRQLFTYMKLKHTSELSESHLPTLSKWCFQSAQEIMGESEAKEMARKIMEIEEMSFIRKLFNPD